MKRVFICSGHSLFSSGIKTLLDAEPDLEVIGWETDVEVASERIQALQPDTVLIVAEGTAGYLASERQRFLRAEGKTQIIELNLSDHKVYVYTGEQIMVQEVGDLVRAIESPDAIAPPWPGGERTSEQPGPKETSR